VPDARTVSTRPWPYQVPTKPAGTLAGAEWRGDTVTVTVEGLPVAGEDGAVDAPPVAGVDGADEVAGKSAGALLDRPGDMAAVPCPSVVELQPATTTATHIGTMHRAKPAMAAPRHCDVLDRIRARLGGRPLAGTVLQRSCFGIG